MLNIIIDGVLILFILIITFIGYKKGLVEVAFKIFSFLIAIALSFALFKPVSFCIINYTPINKTINSYVRDIVDTHINKEKSDTEKNDDSNLPTAFSNYIDKTIEDTSKKVQNDVADVVTTSITSTVINVISFIAVFILSKIILLLLHVFSNVFSKLPLIKQFNEMGGLIYGLIKALLIVFIALAIISFSPLENVKESISNTYVTLFLYNFNPILYIFL